MVVPIIICGRIFRIKCAKRYLFMAKRQFNAREIWEVIRRQQYFRIFFVYLYSVCFELLATYLAWV